MKVTDSAVSVSPEAALDIPTTVVVDSSTDKVDEITEDASQMASSRIKYWYCTSGTSAEVDKVDEMETDHNQNIKEVIDKICAEVLKRTE